MNTLVSAKSALETRQLDKKFASIVLENGFTNKDKIENAVKKQTEQFKKTGDCSTLGDILVRNGSITDQQKRLVFSKQNRKLFTIKPEKKKTDLENSANNSSGITEEDVNKFIKEYSNLPFEVTVKNISNIFSKKNLSIPLGEVMKKEGLFAAPKKEAEKKDAKQAPQKTAPKEEAKEEPAQEKVESNNSEKINVDTGYIDTNAIEKESENPPTIIENDFMDIIIAPDNIEVSVKFKQMVPKHIDVDSLKELLVQNEVTYGHVDDSLIYQFLNDEDNIDKPFMVAEGVAPQYGREGHVKFHFDTDPVKVGALDESGHIDFRDRGEIPHVEQGDLLADIIPSKQGVHGVDVFSNPILVSQVPELRVKCEAGVTLSKDGTQAFASASGQPELIGGRRLAVLQELNISGDVGYKTGHVDFDGNINITGTVQSGFKVKGINVTALEILGAEVEATGNVQVIAGISGATIHTKGDVKAKYINKSKVFASGDLMIEKEIIDSDVENSGICLLPRGKIISSSVNSRRGIDCKDIGTEMSSPCKIKIGGDDKLKKDIAEINKQIKARRIEIESISKKVEEYQEKEQETHVVIAEQAHVQDRSQIEIRELEKEIEELKEKGENVDEKIVEREKLNLKVKQADDKINMNFDSQEKCIAFIEEENVKIDEIEEGIENLEIEKNELVEKSKKDKKTPFAKVSGVLYAGSLVRGVYANVTVRETIRRIKIYESQTKDPTAATAYEMKQSKL